MAKPSSRKKWLRRLLITATVLLLLEFFPGAYTIDDFQDEWEPDSPEGIALLALKDLELDTELWFSRPTRQRISRNAELLVPADTTVTLTATMVPEIIEGEAVARPRTWELRSCRHMTFIYRGVTVARANRMRIRSDDPEFRVRAVGTYRVLSALATAHRYHRQREVKRDYEVPDRAHVDIHARFLPNHSIPVTESTSVSTGSTPTVLHIQNLTWEKDMWTSGVLTFKASLADLESTLNAVATEQAADPIELGGLLALKFRNLHALSIEENRMLVHLNGSITSANSSRVENMFDPSFESRLEFEFTFPEGQSLESAVFGARLKQIHSFDINRSNTVFDKAVRNIARRYRDELTFTFPLAEELPDHPAVPRNLQFYRFGFTGNEDQELVLNAVASIPVPEEEL
jgi:hypothetical protein